MADPTDEPPDKGPTADPEVTTDPPVDTTDEVAKWKAMSKKHEASAKANAEAAKRLATLEEAQKTEAQKHADRAAAAEKEVASLRLDSLRARVALTKGVPADLVDRLRGDTEDDLAEDADRLLALLQPGKPRGNAAQGPRGDQPTEETDPIRLASTIRAGL